MKAAHKAFAGFAATILLTALVVVASLWTWRQVEESAAVRQHTAAVLGSANDFLSGLKDAETGTRGYLLTGDEAYLQPYLAVVGTLSSSLKDLRQLTLVSAAQKQLDTVLPLMDAKLANMAKLIELRRNHDLPVAMAIERSGEGKRLMDSIRVEMANVIGLEEALVVKREAEFQSGMRDLLAIIAAISLLGLLVY